MKEEAVKPDPARDVSTRLSYERTRLSYDRTMMSWIRTGTSLIAFGFTVHKFFQFEANKLATESPSSLINPRRFAMLMIGIGLGALILSKVEHMQGMNRLRAEGAEASFSMASVLAWLVAALGVVAFIAVFFGK
jgi:putative membrane protein